MLNLISSINDSSSNGSQNRPRKISLRCFIIFFTTFRIVLATVGPFQIRPPCMISLLKNINFLLSILTNITYNNMVFIDKAPTPRVSKSHGPNFFRNTFGISNKWIVFWNSIVFICGFISYINS